MGDHTSGNCASQDRRGRCCNLTSERGEDPDSLDINYKESDGWTDRSSHFTMYSGDSSPYTNLIVNSQNKEFKSLSESEI